MPFWGLCNILIVVFALPSQVSYNRRHDDKDGTHRPCRPIGTGTLQNLIKRRFSRQPQTLPLLGMRYLI